MYLHYVQENSIITFFSTSNGRFFTQIELKKKRKNRTENKTMKIYFFSGFSVIFTDVPNICQLGIYSGWMILIVCMFSSKYIEKKYLQNIKI